MIEIDGSRYSGSGTIVRQTVAFAALTGQPVHIFNARVRRPKPGLRRQHVQAVEAVRQLVNGDTEGVEVGSREFVFRPGARGASRRYTWDIGSAGSTTLLALAVLSILAFGSEPAVAELKGGLFQDFAPSLFHLQHVLVPLVARMGLEAEISMERPGYVPRGGGVLVMSVEPIKDRLRPLALEQPAVRRLWGIALASHLQEREVARRMAEAAQKVLARAGYSADITTWYEDTALQPGAALALFADQAGGTRLGTDMAGAPGRRSEQIGRHVARQLLEEIGAGAALDRHAADQIIPFAALAEGETQFQIAALTDHIESNAWLAKEFLGAEVKVQGNVVSIAGVGFRREADGRGSGAHGYTWSPILSTRSG